MKFVNDSIKQEVNKSSRIILDTLGENLRYLRAKRRVSRKKLLYELNRYYGIKMSYNNLVKIEWSKSKQNIELQTVAVFGKYFNKSMHELMFYNLSFYE